MLHITSLCLAVRQNTVTVGEDSEITLRFKYQTQKSVLSTSIRLRLRLGHRTQISDSTKADKKDLT